MLLYVPILPANTVSSCKIEHPALILLLSIKAFVINNLLKKTHPQCPATNSGFAGEGIALKLYAKLERGAHNLNLFI